MAEYIDREAAMDVREKLVDLLHLVHVKVADLVLEDNEKTYSDAIGMEADHLIANGVTVQEWVSVKDRLPEEKVNCIVHYKHAYCDNDGYWAIGFCFYDGEKFQFDPAYKVTHWMPLPQPPKGE